MAYKDLQKKRECQKRHRQTTKYKENAKRLSHELRERRIIAFKEFKSTLSCIICGENRIACLDFHHRNKLMKDFNIARFVRNYSLKRVLEEIKKCDVLCSNCHRVLHYEEVT